jgi:hypothetical protein
VLDPGSFASLVDNVRVAARSKGMEFFVRRRSAWIRNPETRRNLLFTCSNDRVVVTLRDSATGRIERSLTWKSDPVDGRVLIEEGSRLTAEMAAGRIIDIIRGDKQPEGTLNP